MNVIFVLNQDAANRFSLNFGLIRYNPQNLKTVSSLYYDSSGELRCNFLPVLLDGTDDMQANLKINCEGINFENMSSEEYSLIRRPLTSEQIFVSIVMEANWRITEPVVQSTEGNSDDGFNISVEFGVMCSPCKSTDGYILASASISILDRYLQLCR